MNETILAVVIYIAWTMLLILAIALYRTVFNKKHARSSLKFDSSGNDVGALGSRLTRAHANCYESFAFIGAIMLLALATNSAHITSPLALVVVGARIVQSSIHICSTSNAAISARFVFFLVQFIISGYWLFCIMQKFI
ncbi:MAPEG family protein [Glaciecola sp. 2405UD65-10]|uniref:MAPEG family protein n=1 Tax=Glaciecola sp. 2405UD65-10 TaxID=3397244 RepID=UPI003B5A93F1